jgi:hypothetical protein
MKPSHFTTPRSLSECYFDPRGQAIFNETPRATSLMSDTVLLSCFAALAAALAAILYFF